MVTKIKVTNPDGRSISLIQSLLRSSVDILLAVLIVIAEIMAISHVNAIEYLTAEWVDRVEYLTPLYPSWHELVIILLNIWVWGELVVLLLNKRKRAIHDFIAGTVVINHDFTHNDLNAHGTT